MIRPRFRKTEEETGVVKVVGQDGSSVQVDAASAEIVFIDPEKDIQVVMSDDPNNKNGVVCAVMTASAENVEDNELLGSATAEPETAGEGGNGGEGSAAEEARKAEARKRFRERFAARQEARKAENRIKARDEARAKFRAHAK